MSLQGLGAFALVNLHGASSFDINEGLVLPGVLGIGLRDRRDKGRRQANQDNAQPEPEKYLEEETTHGIYLPLVSLGAASK